MTSNKRRDVRDMRNVSDMSDMSDINGNIYCFDGIMYDFKVSKLPFNSKSEVLRIYEVIRVINKVPLFFEEHFSRLNASAKGKDLHLELSLKSLYSFIQQVVAINNLENCNCMVICYFIKHKFHFLIYIRKHNYPDEIAYLEGVKLGILDIERPNPNIKAMDENYNHLTNEAKSNSGIFEVLLVNKQGRITEASKANVFFIKRGIVITPPSKQVLLGVTRKHAIEAVVNSGFEIIENDFPVEQLNTSDGVFITGTSIHLLPVSKVGDNSFHTALNPMFLKIKFEFEKIVGKYIEKEVN